MGIKQDIEDNPKGFEVTKIDGQPTDEDLHQLECKLSEMAASIPTTNGGAMHGQLKMIIPNTEYTLFLNGGTQFITPMNPGPYPTTVDPNPAICECQVVEHKAEQKESKTYVRVENMLCKKIVKAVNPEWLKALQSATSGITHCTPIDYMDVTDLMMELTKPLEITENPATKFARDDKIEHQLAKAGIAVQPSLHLALAMSVFKATGEYSVQICEFKTKPMAICTFNNFRPFIVNEYSKCTN